MAATVLVPPVPNREITSAAREALKGYFAKCALFAFAIFISEFVITFVVELAPIGIVKHLINGFLSVVFNTILGFALIKFIGKISDGEENPEFKPCINFSLERFAVATLAGWYAGLIIFLKFFLLIVPGILAIFDYAMVPYIALDNPNIKIADTLKLSRRLMYGHRWQFFCLNWRFFGWGLLCLLTLGIGFFWLVPYTIASYWKFFRSIIPATDSPEAANLPELKPYNGMSTGWRIFWFIIFTLFATSGGIIEDRKAERIADRAVERAEKRMNKSETTPVSTTNNTAPDAVTTATPKAKQK